MSIKLTYRTVDGKEKRDEYRAGVEEIHLNWKMMASIDLSPFSLCRNLQQLYLDQNEILGIDFTPLRSCVNLKKLRVAGNLVVPGGLSLIPPDVELDPLFRGYR
jgi:hypothetical protein